MYRVVTVCCMLLFYFFFVLKTWVACFLHFPGHECGDGINIHSWKTLKSFEQWKTTVCSLILLCCFTNQVEAIRQRYQCLQNISWKNLAFLEYHPAYPLMVLCWRRDASDRFARRRRQGLCSSLSEVHHCPAGESVDCSTAAMSSAECLLYSHRPGFLRECPVTDREERRDTVTSIRRIGMSHFSGELEMSIF